MYKPGAASRKNSSSNRPPLGISELMLELLLVDDFGGPVWGLRFKNRFDPVRHQGGLPGGSQGLARLFDLSQTAWGPAAPKGLVRAVHNGGTCDCPPATDRPSGPCSAPFHGKSCAAIPGGPWRPSWPCCWAWRWLFRYT